MVAGRQGIEGARELEALAARIKAVGDNDLRKELLRGIRAAVKPLPVAIKAAARSDLPQSGGLAAQIGRSSIVSRTRTSASRKSEPGVRLIGQKERDASKAARKGKTGNAKPPSRFMDFASIDRGWIRHPLFGNRERWFSQQIKPGFWTETINARADDVQRDLVQVLDDVAEKIID